MFRPTTVLWQISAPQLFKVSLLGSTVAALILSTGCSSTPTRTQTTIHPKQVSSNPSDYLDASSLDSLEDLLSATDMRAVEGDRLLILKHGDVWKRMTVGFKMDEGHWDPRIDAQRNWFISRQPYLDRLSARASRYLYHTVKEAERRGMPTELALLPVIESSYDPAATSSASATGLWQFIPSTGKIYGLQQTGSYDARRDVVESTRAAYEFLGSLYNQFGSWELALAAYNAGPGRVQQAINRNASLGLPTDYWSLKLPAETMNYVPRFLAVAQIVKNPRAYGVTLPPIANRPHFREIQIQPGVSMTQIADLSGLSRTELYALNPGYRGEYVDTDSPGRILIPSDVSPAVDRRLMALKGTGYTGNNTWQATSPVKTTVITTQPVIVGSSTPISDRSRANTPVNPDALAAFANNADVPSAPRIPVAVTTANDLKRPINTEPPISIHERDRILAEIKADDAKETVNNVVQPVANSSEQLQVINEIKAIAPAGTQVVDPLDGKIKLTAIQTSQSVADSEGKEVTKSFSYPKNVVDTVSQDSDDAKRNKDRDYVKTDTDVVAVTPKGDRSTYTVVGGDTLATIAMKNGVNWRDIAKWNQIDPNAPLYVGNTLYLYDAKPQNTPVEKPDNYVVKANDSLTAVASQFDLSVKDLADWNNLSTTSNLMIGQKLVLKAPKEVSEQKKAPKVKTQVYSVKRGEYLKLIADRYSLSNQELADLTPDLSANDSLRVGQKINVPMTEEKEQKSHREEVTSSEKYKVKRGDTLNSIATKSNISLSDLAKLNHVRSSYQVRVGQVIQVPEGTQTPTEYTVKSGDTLSNIAARYNLQLDYLASINGLSKGSGVRIGQRLKLDDNDIDDNAQVIEQPEVEQRRGKEKAPTTAHSTKQTESYTVQSGESMHTIAARYGVTVKELAEMNDLTVRTSLRRGQVLDVPKKTVDYKVKSGDNLIRLANKYGIEPKELAEMNDLQPNSQLRLGATIQVPNK
ncbi:lytic transglycosylase [Acinetobacter nectaris]|uniref:lytic transglycosylase n=1 Tax=Acinetobacter nectaris TaxID=1219382 RepID=UPI001F1EA290|nr:LysM peptidoglycan-binding domain-containing protein [Acinetobacter nectaris]MCF9046268.1 LysM peptidoglycan-binding domain-containing protein [Acinetobacter nectaris]